MQTVKKGNTNLLGSTLGYGIAFSKSCIVGNKLQELMYLWVHKRKLNLSKKKTTAKKHNILVQCRKDTKTHKQGS